MNRQRGITFIELMVVIGTIAFFISVVFASQALAKERSKESVCLSRQHLLDIQCFRLIVHECDIVDCKGGL
jgi:Tfp pilus assembly protein PilE